MLRGKIPNTRALLQEATVLSPVDHCTFVLCLSIVHVDDCMVSLLGISNDSGLQGLTFSAADLSMSSISDDGSDGKYLSVSTSFSIVSG